jgi:acetylornithine deacetylase/succinyl-diaminopimelate desuccinylase-like protein
MGYPDEIAGPLLSSDRFEDMLAALPLGMARQFHACTHTTFAPTVIHGGSKTNVIPDTVDIEVDVRTLPGQTADEVHALLDDALGDLAGSVELLRSHDDPSTASPLDTPLWARPMHASSGEPARPRTASACSAPPSAWRTTA